MGLSLEERLDQKAETDAEKHSRASVERVRKVIRSSTDKTTPYRFLKTIYDFALYHSLHPKWQGRTAKEIRSIPRGSSFYKALHRCVNNKPKDKEKRMKLSQQIFKPRPRICMGLSLEERLDQKAETDAEKHSRASVERVRQLIRSSTDKKTLYNAFLKTIDDFALYHSLHPKWQGRSSTEITSIPGGVGFYGALLRRIRNETKDKEKRMKLSQQIFKPRPRIGMGLSLEKRLDQKAEADAGKHSRASVERVRQVIRSSTDKRIPYKTFLKTIDDFSLYHSLHPKWQGRSALEITSIPGGAGFYGALNEWINNKTKDKGKRMKLSQQIFEPRPSKWYHFKTIEDWKKEYDSHYPGLSTGEIRRESEGRAFGIAFGKWIRNKTKDKEKRRKLSQQIFPPRLNDWSSFKTIKDWKREYDSYPEWQGKSTTEIRRELESGGAAFYHALNNWIKKNAKTESERKALVRAIFPERQAPFRYDFGNGDVYFSSYPERIVGILLNKYGLIRRFEEGKNLHVRTNGRTLHSLDFLVGNTFIEYHPVSRDDKKAGRNLKQAGERKHQNKKNPEYYDTGFKHIWDVDQLYDILQDEEVNPLMYKRYGGITKEKFQKHVSETYQKAVAYDAKYPNRNARKISGKAA